MNHNSIIDFKKKYIKNEVTLYCGRFDPDFAHLDQHMMNPNDLPPLIVVNNYLND